MADLSFQPLQDVADLLTAAGLPTSTNPEDVNLPGGWVTMEEFSTRNLAGDIRVTAVVYLIAENTDHRRAMEQLAAAYNLARTVLTPDGPVRAQGVILPSAPTEPMPALRIPLYVPGHADPA
jgi:hypothetical protein